MRNTYKNIRDCIHGDLHFTKLECHLMDSYPFQRLRGIRQLGTSYLVYPGAVHTRFEHSLGTCFMAKRIVRSIEENYGQVIDQKTRDEISVAALLHDVTHIPFGHTLEDERRILRRHDQDQSRMAHFLSQGPIGEFLQEKQMLDSVANLLCRHGFDEEKICFPWQVISHAICADLLDYLKRDAAYCGLSLNYDDRIFRYFQIENGKLILNLQKNGLFRHDAFQKSFTC